MLADPLSVLAAPLAPPQVGVGYSYADDGNYTTGDDETARVNLGVLRGFFDRFPQLRKNRLFISGESYAVRAAHRIRQPPPTRASQWPAPA